MSGSTGSENRPLRHKYICIRGKIFSNSVADDSNVSIVE